MMIRPMFDRVAMQGSMRSMSSPRTMVTSLASCAKAGASGSSASAEESSRVVRFIRSSQKVFPGVPRGRHLRAARRATRAPANVPASGHVVNMIINLAPIEILRAGSLQQFTGISSIYWRCKRLAGLVFNLTTCEVVHQGAQPADGGGANDPGRDRGADDRTNRGGRRRPGGGVPRLARRAQPCGLPAMAAGRDAGLCLVRRDARGPLGHLHPPRDARARRRGPGAPRTGCRTIPTGRSRTR